MPQVNVDTASQTEQFPAKPPTAPPDERRGFWPSLFVRHSYLLTRHSSISIGSRRYPGLFTIQSFPRDSVILVGVLILEVLGLWLLGSGYWESFGIRRFSDPGAWFPALLAFVAVIVDLGAAVFHHWPYKAQLCRFENELLRPRSQRFVQANDAEVWVENDLEWRLYNHSILRISRTHILSLMCSALIILLAMAKITLIQTFLPTSGENMKIPIIISYVLCAMGHIFVTGYFLAGLTTKWGIPPFPFFLKVRGENEEKHLLRVTAAPVYGAQFISEATGFHPFECLLDDETPFEIRPTEARDPKTMKHLDSAYHSLSIIAVDLPRGHQSILSDHGLDTAALDKKVYELSLSDERWKSLLDRLGAIPVELRDVRPETVRHSLELAKNSTLRSLIDHRYVFSTYGLLRDEHLGTFLANQPQSAKAAVLRWAHFTQIRQLEG